MKNRKVILITCFVMGLLFVFSKANALTLDPGTDETIIIGSSIILGGNPVATGGEPPYTYEWAEVDGPIISSLENPEVSPTVTTQYQLTVVDGDGFSCCAEIITITVALPVDIDVRETQFVFNRMGLNDPRLEGSDIHSRNRLVIFHVPEDGRRGSFDVVRIPQQGPSGILHMQVEIDGPGANTIFDTLKTNENEKTFTCDVYDGGLSLADLGPDIVLSFGLDDDGSETLTSDEIYGEYEIWVVTELDYLNSKSKLNTLFFGPLGVVINDLTRTLNLRFTLGTPSNPWPYPYHLPTNYGSITFNANNSAISGISLSHNSGVPLSAFQHTGFTTLIGRPYYNAQATVQKLTWNELSSGSLLFLESHSFKKLLNELIDGLSYGEINSLYNAAGGGGNIRVVTIDIPAKEYLFGFPTPGIGSVGLGGACVTQGQLELTIEKQNQYYIIGSVSHVIDVELMDLWDHHYFDPGPFAQVTSATRASASLQIGNSRSPSNQVGEPFVAVFEIEGPVITGQKTVGP